MDRKITKSCPKCGNEAIITIFPGIGKIRVHCKICNAKTEWFDRKNQAVKAWNKRKIKDGE